MGAKKKGVEKLIKQIDEKVSERKKIPYAPKGFSEDQETLAMSRHELLVERNKLSKDLKVAEIAMRNLRTQMAGAEVMASEKLAAMAKLREDALNLRDKALYELEVMKSRATKPLVTADGKPNIENVVIKEVEKKFDLWMEFALIFLVLGGILLGVAICNANYNRGTYEAMLQMQSEERADQAQGQTYQGTGTVAQGQTESH